MSRNQKESVSDCPEKYGLLDTKIKHIQKGKKSDQLYNKLLINEMNSEGWLGFQDMKLVEIVDS